MQFHLPGVSFVSELIHSIRSIRGVIVTSLSFCPCSILFQVFHVFHSWDGTERFANAGKMMGPGFLIGGSIEPYLVGVRTEWSGFTFREVGVISFLWPLFSFLRDFCLSDEEFIIFPDLS